MTLFGITGSARSGTTILRNSLMEDSQIFCFNEAGLFNWTDVITLHDKIATHPDNRNKKFDGATLRLLYHEKKLTKSQLVDEIIKHVRQYNYQVEWIGDKYPDNMLYKMPDIAYQYEGFKFIVMIRDGRDVLASSLRRYKRTVEKSEGIAPFMSSGYFCKEAQLWELNMSTFLRNVALLDNDNILILRHEDVVSDLKTTADRITKFLRLKKRLDIHCFDKYQKLHIGEWMKDYPNMENYLSSRFKNYLRLFGYK